MITPALLLLCSFPTPALQSAGDKPQDVAGLVLAAARMDDAVLLDLPGDGNLWAVGANWKAAFGSRGTTFYPFLGSEAPRSESARFDVVGIEVAGEPLEVRAASVSEWTPEQVTFDRGVALERYHLRSREIEQTFVFESLPALGAIEVQLALETTMTAVFRGGAGIDFFNNEGLGMGYSGAVAFDSVGQRTDVELARSFDGITLTVPADFVQRAVLPLTIDPVITRGTVATEAYAEYEPDVAYFAEMDRWVVSYHRYFSTADVDVYVRTVTPTGAVSSAVIIDSTLAVWSNARVAAVRGSGGGLVVASVVNDDPTTEDGVIRGRRMAIPFLSPGPTFDLSEVGSRNNVNPAIAADHSGAPGAQYFVTWVREYAPNDGDIHGRLVAGDGTVASSAFAIENASLDDDRGVAVSPSPGASNGDFLLAWERGGNIWARRVGITGDLTGRPSYLAMLAARRPSVSSFMNKRIAGQPIAAIAAEITAQSSMGPLNESVGLVLVDEGDGVGRRFNLSAMEDYLSDGEQTHPAVVADDTGFLLGYAETYFPGDDDIHMLSGTVTISPAGAEPALAERHGLLANSGINEARPSLASQWDGDGTGTLAFGVWQDGDDTATGNIEYGLMGLGYTPSTPPVGVQSDVCLSNPNSTGVSSWMVIGGDQTTTSVKTLYCVNVPLQTFGVFITSRTIGFSPNPAGSQGNLCLGGQIGRLSTAIFSGTSGVLQQSISTITLPTPFGPVATVPGERWHFQAWHRDSVGGMATSNFSGVASIVFQ